MEKVAAPLQGKVTCDLVAEHFDERVDMNFDRIDRLVTEERFCFQAWDDRYGKGVWAALGSSEGQIDIVRNLSSAGDLDMDPATNYVLSSNWLPYVTGRTLGEAMKTLEERLSSLPQDQLIRESQWTHLVYEAIDALSDATHNRSWYGDKSPESLDDLPATFNLALASAKA
jgi:hypothetical protein